MIPSGGEDERQAEPRQGGVSPVVEGGGRSKLGLAAGVVVIVLVVGFLFVTGGKNSKPRPAAPPALPSSPGLPPAAPAPPPLPPLTPEEAAAGFPPPPVPGKP